MLWKNWRFPFTELVSLFFFFAHNVHSLLEKNDYVALLSLIKNHLFDNIMYRRYLFYMNGFID